MGGEHGVTRDNSTRSIIEHKDGHLRVLGLPCSGKTTAMLDRFRWLESQGRHPAIIAYGRDHRDRLVESLLPDGSARLGRVPVWSFPQLANEVLRAARPGARSPLGELEEHVLLDRLIAQNTDALRSDYRNIIDSDALRETLLSVVHTLLQNDIDPGADPGGDHRLADVLLLYRCYRDRLVETKNCTFYDVAWRAAEVLAGGAVDHPVLGADVLLIDDFNDIDAGQFELLLRLAPPGGNTAVNVFGDPTTARFRFRGTSETFLNTHFPARYAPAEFKLARASALDVSTADAVSPDASTQEGQLGLFDTAHTGAGTPGVETTTAVAEDEIAEARWVVEVAQRLVSGGTSAGEVAVIVRDPNRYRTILSRAFDDAGVPFDAGLQRTGPVEQLALGLMRGLGAGEVDAAEILRDSPLYRRVFDAFAPTLEMETYRRTPGEAGRIVGHIRRSSFVGKGRFSMSRFRVCIDTVIEGTDAGPEARAALDALRDAWYGYSEMTTSLQGSPSLSGFLRLRRAGTVERVGARRGAVRMLTPREASGRSFDVVILAGCAEGVFPMVESSPGYVPWQRLEALVETAAFPVELQGGRSRELLLEDDQAMLVATLARARRYLYVSAPVKLDGEATVAPSSPLVELFKTVTPERVGRRPGLAGQAAVAVQQGRATGGLQPDVAAAGRIERLWLSPRPTKQEFTLGRFNLSPSRMGTLETCERRFFYSRVLRLDTEDSVPMRLGSSLHRLLEGLVEGADDIDALRARLGDEVIDALAEQLAGELDEDVAMAASIRFHTSGLLRGLRRLEGERKPITRFEASEWRWGFEVEGYSFGGVADRVDVLPDGGIVVVDYKTGVFPATASTVRKKVVDTTRPVSDRDWQVALYSRAVQAEYEQPPVSFCYYHMSPGKEVNAIELRLQEGGEGSAAFSDIQKKRVDTVARAEIDEVITRAVTLARQLFAERNGFARTDDRKRCRNCPFARVCERDE